MNEERRRARIAEEVNDAESVANEGLGKYTDVELEAMNQQLDKLRNEATSLRMPTRRIDQLKLQVSSAIGGTRTGPGPRGKEKVRPLKLNKKARETQKRANEALMKSPDPMVGGEPPTAIPQDSPAGEKIRRKLEEQGKQTLGDEISEQAAKGEQPITQTMGQCPACQHEFAIPIEIIVNNATDRCPNCENEVQGRELVNALANDIAGPIGPEGEPGYVGGEGPPSEPSKGGPSRKGQGQGVKARPKPPKPGETRRKMSELFGE